MPRLPDISDAEWDVMKTVWQHEPLTSGDVVKHLAGEKHWKPRTVKTLLARLVRKGAVSAQPQPDGRFLYASKVSREALERREARTFLSRVFDGAVAPALVHLVQEGRLSRSDVAELKKILDQEARR